MQRQMNETSSEVITIATKIAVKNNASTTLLPKNDDTLYIATKLHTICMLLLSQFSKDKAGLLFG